MKIIYCLSRPVSFRDEERYRIAETKKKLGAEIEYWLFTSINNLGFNDSFPNTEIIENKLALRNAFSRLPEVFELIFIFPFTKKTLWIHKEFSRSKIPFNYLQLTSNEISRLTLVRSLLFRLRFIHLRGCKRLLTCRSYTKFRASPFFVISVTSKIKRFASNEYLQFLNLNEGYKEPSNAESEYLVFLDSYLEGHPDYTVPLVRESARYWDVIQSIINKYSEKYNLRVIIKEHPRRTSPIPIKSFVVSKDDTLSLITNSVLVLCHATTAVNMVAMAKIPLVQIGLDDLCASRWYKNWIKRINKSLNSKVITNTQSRSDFLIPEVDQKKYSNYVKKHLYEDGVSAHSYADFLFK